MTIPNQANFQTSQGYSINIDKIYSDFIQEIDSNRSVVNISVGQDALNNLNANTITGLNSLLKIENTPQESRAHCFYRLIGFPVVANDLRYYNPGLDNVEDPVRQFSLADKIKIANSPFAGFREISLAREQYALDFLKVFSVRPASITATGLALTSVKVRPFNIPTIKSIEPFTFSKENQSYNIGLLNFTSTIGSNDKALLLDYQDDSGAKPDPNQLKGTRTHFIQPFIVDPRIDFSCNPASRLVSVPFVPTKSNLLVSENTFVKRPLLEKIIRERFTVQDQVTTSGKAGKDFSDYITNVTAVQNEDIIKQIAQGDLYKLGDQLQFKKYFDIIQAMVDKLVKALLDIQTVQSRYYWLPLPSGTGPEGGSQISPVIISQTLPSGDNNSFITAKDQSIINISLIQASNQFNAQTSKTQGVPDAGGFAFDFFKSFDVDTSKAYGDNAGKQLTQLNKDRNHDLKSVNNSLRTIEIIMGEFSGLGLCDIIAVMAALYLMPKESLLGFLDDDAYRRMTTTSDLSTQNIPAKANITTAYTDFLAKVKDFYNLMDDIFKEAAQRNNLSGLSA